MQNIKTLEILEVAIPHSSVRLSRRMKLASDPLFIHAYDIIMLASSPCLLLCYIIFSIILLFVSSLYGAIAFSINNIHLLPCVDFLPLALSFYLFDIIILQAKIL